MARFVAAVVQAAPVWMDRAATTKKACRLIHEASQQGARIVAFPESFIPAFPYGVWHHGVRRNMRFYQQLTECAVSLDGPEISMIQELMVSRRPSLPIPLPSLSFQRHRLPRERRDASW